jgi:restriction endonuclease S subunit
MSSKYKLSSTVNPNKVFLIKSSALEGRLDPSWYVYLKSILSFKHKKVALKNLLLENPQYGANEIGIERNTETEPRYIRITDINDFGELEKTELGKTATIIEDKYFLKENDLLLARSGNTVGKSYLHTDVGYDCFFAGYMIRFKIDTSKVLPQYIFAYTQTDFYRKWVKAIQRTTGQPNINAEEYKSLEIPLPDTSTQKKIINIYFLFLEQKRLSEAQAAKLLASIDDYLLKELGITLPKQSENTLKSRMFVTEFSKVSGNRLDCYYYLTEDIERKINKGNYKAVSFSTVIRSLINGFDFRDYKDSGTPYIKVANVRKGDFDFSKIQYIEWDTTEIEKAIQLKKGNILLTRKGTFGYALSLEEDLDYVISSEIFYIELKQELLNSKYLEMFFNSAIGQKQFDRIKIGAIMGSLSQEAVKALKIPLPPLSKQKEIAERITSIRHEAQKLKDKTKEAMQKASKEIEKILLG